MSRKLLHLLFILIIALTITSTITFALHDKNLKHQSASSGKTLNDYYTQGQSLKKNTLTQQAPSTVTFLAVGDISLSRNIAQTIKTKQDPLYPFRGIEPLLKSTDFNFGNLETPFSSSDAFTPKNTLVFNAPKANVAGLTAYNFAVLNLANNHAFDQGVDGVTTTSRVLDENNLLHMGTGNTLEQAWTPAIIEKNGIKIGFIGASYSSVNDGGKTTNPYVARIEDLHNLQSAIKNLQSKVDFIVVTMHAGTEYTKTANAAQIKFAHAAIDAGADIVIGAHPHWVQEKELYCPTSGSPSRLREGGPDATSGAEGSLSGSSTFQRTPSSSSPTIGETSPSAGEAGRGIIDSNQSDCKWIYYSLGNFIFDQSWSEPTKQGLALKITLTKNHLPPTTSGYSSLTGGENSNSPSRLREGGPDATSGTEGSNTATLNDLQPTGGTPKPLTNIETIEEIPISIKENCCPFVVNP